MAGFDMDAEATPGSALSTSVADSGSVVASASTGSEAEPSAEEGVPPFVADAGAEGGKREAVEAWPETSL
jgi:hypothetical protein